LTPEIRRLLAGSLVVALNSDSRTVDVYFVKSDGERSAEVVTSAAG
jgi:hypothetical protein